MRKIFTLFAMGMMVIPSVSAAEKEITVTMNWMKEYAPAEVAGEFKTTLTYDEATKVYSIPDFLGYKDANGNSIALKFQIGVQDAAINNAYWLYAYDPKCDTSKSPSETDCYYKWANSWYTYFTLPLPENPNSTLDFEPHMSAVIGGEDYDWKLFNPQIYFPLEQKPNVNIGKRTYAVIEEGVYKVVIDGSGSVFRKLKDSEAWPTTPFEDPDYYNSTDFPFNLSFSIPTEFAGVDGVEIEIEDAPVEYFNLNGVKVENPAAGIYVKRQGDKVTKVVIK